MQGVSRKSSLNLLEEIRKIIRCDFKTGKLYWLEDRPAKVHKGDEAGSIHRYSRVNVLLPRYGKVVIRRSWIVWALSNGRWPHPEIDHKDRNPRNDSLRNLREATSSQNNANKLVSKNSRTGIKGVSLHRKTGLWRARIGHQGRMVKYFKTKEAAAAGYLAMSKAEYGEFARA